MSYIDLAIPNPTTESRGNSFINWKMIFRLLGGLLLFEAILYLICTVVALFYREADYLVFLEVAVLNVMVGSLLQAIFHRADRQLSRRDAYCIVTFSWIIFSLSGMLPYLLSGSIVRPVDAFFETVSGFTTTGASILNDIESLSHGMLFWRSLTQWVGGVGIVFFTIAIFPFFGGESLQLFSAESTGVKKERILPKISVTVKWIGMIYLALAMSEAILLRLGGMGWFDAINHALTTTATGGYSTKQDSIAYWNSPYIHYVVATFVMMSGVNFSLYCLCLRGRVKRLFQDDELRFYIRTVFIITAIITATLCICNNYELEPAFRSAYFQVTSIITTTGFATDDYLLWPSFTWMLLLFCMLAGGCTGSTSGGLKNMRLLILLRSIKMEFRRKLHPNAVLPVKADGRVISNPVVSAVTTFVIFYLLCIIIGWIALLMMGLGMVEAMSASLSALSNVGPALGDYGPMFNWFFMPDAAKWLTSFLMLIGRLELFCVLLILSPDFWRHR